MNIAMNIVITGGSGFLGKRVTSWLQAEGHTVKSVSLRAAPLPDAFAGSDAVIHLAGEPVAQRWTDAARKRILDSRVQGTRSVIRALEKLAVRPRLLVSASAVGYYGSRGDEILTEASTPGSGFLAEVCVAWERAAQAAEGLGIRVVHPRIGVVLGRGGGALERMLLPFKLGIGGKLGTGRQWMSWIHVDDLCALLSFLLNSGTLTGPVNAAAPHPVTNEEFTRELARALHRPAAIPVPAVGLKLLFGEMAQVLLEGQRVLPNVALEAGFQFKYREIAGALQQILAE